MIRVTLPKTILVLSMLALSGCMEMTAEIPAPAIDYGLHGGATSSGAHTVMGRETLWDIAERYKLSMADIIYVNGLQAPYNLRQGQRLFLPPPNVYKVKNNDTLYSISRTFSISTTELARLNSLTPPYNVAPGNTLRLPAGHQHIVVAVTQPRVAPLSPVPRMASVSVAPVNEEPLAPPPRLAPVSAAPLDPVTPAASIIPVEKSSAVAEAEPISITPASMQTPARASSKFIWPVDGPVLSSYGPKEGGLHNDGINIKAAQGTPVRAAENGIVAYAGDELKGFGNLVLIRHADRWVTAYAHLNNIQVERGQEIRQGQTIGAVGQTGSVDSPQLHFEVRRGSEALNPKPYLAQQGI
jgi:murein DD-endopeptidase MepM/ murein hydrolase activator NlpD